MVSSRYNSRKHKELYAKRLNDTALRSESRKLSQSLEKAVHRYHMKQQDLEHIQREVIEPLRDADKAYARGDLTSRDYNHLLQEARETLYKITHKTDGKKRKKGDDLANILDKGLEDVAAVVLLGVSIFFLDKASITGYAVSAATGTSLAGFYSLIGFVLIGVAVLLFVYQGRHR